MNVKIKKAMLLAAGLGTRLRPITYKIPKPLLPFGSASLIDHQLGYLKKFGIEEIAINLHHLGNLIRDHVGNGRKYDLEIRYFDEPIILGTGGGIKNCESFFGETPFVSLNSDVLIAANLGDVIDRHLKTKAAATLVVKPIGESLGFTPLEIDENDRVAAFGRGSHLYTGLQVLSVDILKILPPTNKPSCLVNEGYKKILKQGGRIDAFLYNGYWNDLGTIDRYEQARKDISEGLFSLEV